MTYRRFAQVWCGYASHGSRAMYDPLQKHWIFEARSGDPFPCLANNGDEFHDIDTLRKWVYYDGEWTVFDDGVVAHTEKAVRPRPANCKNCGAVLHGYVCEYCGTEYLNYSA